MLSDLTLKQRCPMEKRFTFSFHADKRESLRTDDAVIENTVASLGDDSSTYSSMLVTEDR